MVEDKCFSNKYQKEKAAFKSNLKYKKIS